MNQNLLISLTELLNRTKGFYDLASFVSGASPVSKLTLSEILRRAAANGELDILILSHSLGGSIDEADPNSVGYLPIDLAAYFGAENNVVYLASQYDDPKKLYNAADIARKRGYASIHDFILKTIKTKILDALEEAIDPESFLRDQGNLQCFRCAIKSNDPLIFQSALDGIMRESCRVYNTQALRLAHQAGGNFNSNPRLAHVAAENGSFECFKYLAENGVDINAKDFLGNVPRSLAEKGGHYIIVEYIDSFFARQASTS